MASTPAASATVALLTEPSPLTGGPGHDWQPPSHAADVAYELGPNRAAMDRFLSPHLRQVMGAMLPIRFRLVNSPSDHRRRDANRPNPYPRIRFDRPPRQSPVSRFTIFFDVYRRPQLLEPVV
jgi:hypothetical protein